ncbi:MAG TPA: hypothetical protein VM030_01890 [Acidimicrobiales bacterium]|nr:hypothetical protein [Acidimicrobiales bacterium]
MRRRLLACAAIAAAVLVTTALPARADRGTMSGVVYAGPCATSYDIATEAFVCRGAGVWLGFFNGPATFAAKGTVGVVSGDARGTITYRFRGQTPFGYGELTLSGPFTIEGATGETKASVTVRSGTGALTKMSGQMTITGISPVTGGPSNGNYEGRWETRP